MTSDERQVFEVTITRTTETTICIAAESRESAGEAARGSYEAGHFDDDAGSVQSYEIDVKDAKLGAEPDYDAEGAEAVPR